MVRCLRLVGGCLLALVLGVIAAEIPGPPKEETLVISEFSALGDDRVLDDDGETSDWVEIWNRGTEAVNLAGWHLSDDLDDPEKWTFPSVDLAVGAYLLVYASEKDRVDPSKPLHANFKLSGGGEALAFLPPKEISAVAGHAFRFPKQREGFSFGLTESGNYHFLALPMPGAANEEDGQCFVADTKFSVDRGFYAEPIMVEITCETPDAVIHYTLDGSDPDAETSMLYVGPVSVAKTTVLRAQASRRGWVPSGIDTQTYLFLSDVVRQSPHGEVPLGWPTDHVNGQVFDFGMDPDVVDDPAYSDEIIPALRAVPSLSLVIDQRDLTSSETGIYVNADEDGREWERRGSVELLDPDGGAGFSSGVGVRMRGGASRDGDNPKHSFRLFFRSDYDGILKFPLFGDEGVDAFTKVDLRTAQNYSWSSSSSGNPTRNTFLREIFSRDTQRAMGQPYTRSRYYHLYLNGQYWGLYMTQERSTDDYAADYLGGKPEDYDVIKVDSGPHTVSATEGSLEAFEQLHGLIQGEVTDADFYTLQGMTPEGADDPGLTKHVDVRNLIDYMMIIFYVGSFDAPLAGDTRANNFFAVRSRGARDGWKFFCHDVEHSMLRPNENRMGPFPAGEESRHFNPQYLHQQLMQAPAYRLAFADRVHQEFRREGLLTPASIRERWQARQAEIELAIIAESARWGDAKRDEPYTKADWLDEIDWVLNDYLSDRTNDVFDQMTEVGLTGDLPVPEFSQSGGVVAERETFRLRMSVLDETPGQIIYTLDGSDPRLPNGTAGPSARVYDRDGEGILLEHSGKVQVRLFKDGKWSPLNSATFIVSGALALPENVLLSEIMYHPAPPGLGSAFADPDAFEFLELWNPTNDVVDLTGARFEIGLDYVFPLAQLGPGERGVLVNTRAAFEERYGTSIRILGEYSGDGLGRLSNGGERLLLRNVQGELVIDVRYEDSESASDGGGFSLEANQDGAWTVGMAPMGSPGSEDRVPLSRYDQWKLDWLLEEDAGDPDRDGLVNLMEYALGSDPKALTLQQPVSLFLEGSLLSVIAVRDVAAEDVDVVFEVSPDLKVWTLVEEPLIREDDAALARFRLETEASDAVSYRARYRLGDS